MQTSLLILSTLALAGLSSGDMSDSVQETFVGLQRNDERYKDLCDKTRPSFHTDRTPRACFEGNTEISKSLSDARPAQLTGYIDKEDNRKRFEVRSND